MYGMYVDTPVEMFGPRGFAGPGVGRCRGKLCNDLDTLKYLARYDPVPHHEEDIARRLEKKGRCKHQLPTFISCQPTGSELCQADERKIAKWQNPWPAPPPHYIRHDCAVRQLPWTDPCCGCPPADRCGPRSDCCGNPTGPCCPELCNKPCAPLPTPLPHKTEWDVWDADSPTFPYECLSMVNRCNISPGWSYNYNRYSTMKADYSALTYGHRDCAPNPMRYRRDEWTRWADQEVRRHRTAELWNDLWTRKVVY